MYNQTGGTARKVLSNLSKMPPCPGSIFPESLTPVLRFIIDSTKSPRVEKITVSRLITSHCDCEKTPTKWHTGIELKSVNTTPPSSPSIVFLGEIFSINLCLPKSEPTQKAPVSEIHTNAKKLKIIFGENS